MSLREKLFLGQFNEIESTEITTEVHCEIECPEGNAFELKNKARLVRMQKSSRARSQRKQIKSIKEKQRQLGFHNC